MGIVQAFLATAKRYPSKCCAVSVGGMSRSYGGFEDLVRSFAGGLIKLVRPGDRIVLHLPNSVEYLALYLAGGMVGATVVPVDAQAKAQTLEHVCRDCEPALVLTPQNAFSILGDAYLGPPIGGNSTALIMYTSGTTGPPKGAVITHENLLFTARRICEWAGIWSNDRELTTLRLSHSFGLGHFHCYMLAGGTFFVGRDAGDLPQILDIIECEGITSFPATPALITTLLRQHKPQFIRACHKLRYMIINSAPMPPDLTRELLEALPNTDVYMYYGLTEASRSTYIHYNSHPDKLRSVGRPVPGVQVRIQDGEIQIQGPNVVPGYWGGESVRGWFATGDLGYLDDEGFLYVTGRLKEQINIDGIKCNPWEVEQALLKHPAVADCAVIGLPHQITHEQVVACVVLKPHVQPSPKLTIELRRHCLHALEARLVPARVHFIDAVPKTDSGKPQRMALRAQMGDGHV